MERIESVLKTCPMAEQVWVYGNSFESCLVAVVVPKEKALLDWADKQGLDGSYQVKPSGGQGCCACGSAAAASLPSCSTRVVC